MFNFKQTEYDMIFEESPESTKQLCTFLLNISKVKRKGGVCELDFSPIRIKSEESNNEWPGGLPIPLESLDTTIVGRGEAGIAFNSFSKNFCCCLSLVSSWREMFSFIFFISSTILYSIVSKTTNVLREDGELDEEWITWGGVEVCFLTTLSLAVEVKGFCFWIGCIGSTRHLLIVLTSNYSYSFSLS